MGARGKSINLFVMDGNASGRVKCTLANWTGVAYRIPRTMLDSCKERDDLKQSGVYFLFGVSDETSADVVYVGQAGSRKNGEGVLYRLLEHARNPEKEYWTEAIAFITSNNSFGPTEISYLENRFCNLAIQAKRYIVKNINDPTPGNITEEKESELEEFIDYARVIMGVLGHKLFDSVSCSHANGTEPPNIDDDRRLYLKRKVNKVGVLEATGLQTSDGFVVLSGSHISPICDRTTPAAVKKIRRRATIDQERILQEDVLLSSPSAASSFVIGKSDNGLTSWRTKDGVTLKELNSKLSI